MPVKSSSQTTANGFPSFRVNFLSQNLHWRLFIDDLLGNSFLIQISVGICRSFAGVFNLFAGILRGFAGVLNLFAGICRGFAGSSKYCSLFLQGYFLLICLV